MTLTVLVADDEALARSRLVRMLSRLPDVQVVAEAASGAEAIERSLEHEPQLLLLDIDMPGGDGFSVAEHIAAPFVVFTTAHAQYAALAFEANAVDYLLKPVVQERLERALERVRERLTARAAIQATRTIRQTAIEPSAAPEQIVVHELGRMRFFDPRTVTRFHAEDKYTTFSMEGAEHLLRESLNALEQRLASVGFVRVHRSELVRLDAVRILEPDSGGALLHLSDGQRVTVSRRFLPALKQALGLR
jgi:DNA-binding LytR/AlgR family response regulator